MTSFGSRLRELRLSRNATQEALADVLGVSAQTVSKWERGKSSPDLSFLPPIALYFQITVDALLGVESAAPAARDRPLPPLCPGEDLEEWTNSGTEDELVGFKLPASCAFASAASCTFSSASLCAFNTPPPSACGLFNNRLCAPPWAEASSCQTLTSNGHCVMGSEEGSREEAL